MRVGNIIAVDVAGSVMHNLTFAQENFREPFNPAAGHFRIRAVCQCGWSSEWEGRWIEAANNTIINDHMLRAAEDHLGIRRSIAKGYEPVEMIDALPPLLALLERIAAALENPKHAY